MREALLLLAALFGSAVAGKTGRSVNVRCESLPPAMMARSDAPSGYDLPSSGSRPDILDELEKAGVTPGAALVLEGFKNFEGGLDNPKIVGASTFDLSITLDMQKLCCLEGGEIYADFEDHAGQNPTTAIVGDLQVFDKLNSSPYLQLFEFWYQQEMFDNKLRLKIGKIDANTEFSVIDYGLSFISSSTQVSPTVFLFPTTPDPMPGVNLFFTPTRALYASAGAFYANRSERFGDFVGNPQDNQLSEFGGFFIFETGLEWSGTFLLPLAGNLKLGGWGDNGTFARLDGGIQNGTGGVYAILDQTVLKLDGDRRVKAFLEYGLTQQTINPIDKHFGAGITWSGPLSFRPKDLMGFTGQYAHCSPDADLRYSYEFALEWFYKFKVGSWGAVMPDIQYIIHPGGQYPNAWVGTARLEIQL